VGWTVVFLAAGMLLSLAVLFAISRLLGHGPEETGMLPLALQGVVMLAAYGSLTWLIGTRVLRLSWEDLRVSVPGGASGFALGFVGAAAMAMAALLLSVPAAGAHWTRDTGGLWEYAGKLGGTALELAPAALAEELMLRGLPIVLMSAAFSRRVAIVVLAVLFGLFHLLNPSIDPLAVGNIALAGVFLGLAFFAPGGLWTAWGAHFGWNLAIAASDAPVSGIRLLLPMIEYVPGSPRWVSGGPFGPEGGVLATAVLLTGCYILGRRARKDGLA
jgi:membrane protease YdiL (CAAX protease family)